MNRSRLLELGRTGRSRKHTALSVDRRNGTFGWSARPPRCKNSIASLSLRLHYRVNSRSGSTDTAGTKT
jgi:hypothetical protein